MEISRIALGTVQLGMSYGISNTNGQPSQSMVFSILDYALEQGVFVWDTSPMYGDSERLIGQYLKSTVQKPIISTKLPKLSYDLNYSIGDEIDQCLTQSLSALGVNSIDYYLIHHEHDFKIHGSQILDILSKYKAKNVIKKIGLSVYSPQVAIDAIQSGLIDAIQLPYNLFDHRFELAMQLAQAKQITVFVRSVFLQGLFFLSPLHAEERVAGSYHFVKNVQELALEKGIPLHTFALLFVLRNASVSQVLVGVDDVNQLKLNLMDLSTYHLDDQTSMKIRDLFQDIPEQVLNPILW